MSIKEALMEATGFDSDSSEEIVNTFYVQSKELINQGIDAYYQRDMDQVKKVIHQLKGSASSVRASVIFQISMEIEEMIHQNQTEKVGVLLTGLKSLFDT